MSRLKQKGDKDWPVWILCAFLLACESSSAHVAWDYECADEPARPTGLIVAGSGSNIDLARAIAQRYEQEHAGSRVVVPDSIGTSGAVRALVHGKIDVGLASRRLKQSETALGVVEIPLVRVEVVFAVHGDVPTESLDLSSLSDIYGGRQRSWPDGTPVVPLLREKGDSARIVIERRLPRLEEVFEESAEHGRWRICYTDAEMIEALSSIPGSIGFIDRGVIGLSGPGVKVLAIGNQTAEAGSRGPGIQLGFKTLSLLTLGEPAGEASRFIEFARSSEVADILPRGGYIAFGGPE